MLKQIIVFALLAVAALGQIPVPGNSSSSASATGLIWRETKTASASATLDFTTCISATYDTYYFEIRKLIPATNAQALKMLVSTDGGSTWLSTNYIWRQGRYYSGGLAASASSSDSSFTLGFSQSSSTLYNSGLLVMRDPATGPNWEWHGQGFDTAAYIGFIGSGSHATTGINAVRFQYPSGTIASGTIHCSAVARS